VCKLSTVMPEDCSNSFLGSGFEIIRELLFPGHVFKNSVYFPRSQRIFGMVLVVLQCVVMCYIFQEVRCSVLQCIAVHCSMLQCMHVVLSPGIFEYDDIHSLVRCSVLQCVEVFNRCIVV